MPTTVFESTNPLSPQPNTPRQILILSDEGEYPSRDWNNHNDRHFLGSHGLRERSRIFNYKVDEDGTIRKFDSIAGYWVVVHTPIPESHLALIRARYPAP